MKKLAGLALSTLLAMSAFSMVPEANAKELNKETQLQLLKTTWINTFPNLYMIWKN
ncbi:hypothetical protein [Brevibacillus sp. VP]|uniref:hypothetical protein n=1 Tax=unclassified Brevibacillus TaxID=2684853 RepID=UPI001374ED93|nr:hypothetical protein [Brevibacillus sp. VP]